MRRTGGMFVPRRRLGLAGTTLERIFNHYLTPISIGVALIGIVLVLAGPVRAAWANRPQAATGGEASSGSQAQAGLAGLSDVSVLSPVEFTRQLIAFTTIPNRPRRSIVTYTVKPGDTLFGIAGKFSIDPKTIFWSNAVLEDNVHLLQPGMGLVIPPVDGVYYTADGAKTLKQAAADYGVDVNVILSSQYNELAGYTADQAPNWGMKILVPGGKRALVWKNPVVATTNAKTGKTVYSFMGGQGGSCSNTSGGGGSGSWVRPLNDYSITQSFYDGHSGIDLGAPLGTPVYAADSGVVIFSGWSSWGYGILIVIDHSGPGGWTTYYAHLNSKAVGCGQFVERGQQIGQVGSTGNSNGAHLHFEMRWNHVPSNPAGNIGF